MIAYKFANVQAYVQDFLDSLQRAAALKGPRTFIVEVRGADLSEDELTKLS